MLLIGHEHVMKIDERIMNVFIVAVALALLFIVFCCEKPIKAHALAFTMFP